MAGELCGICTAPWHKKRMADAGLPPTGHTEVLLERTASPDGLMLLAGDTLRVALEQRTSRCATWPRR
jgi:4-hydroxy-L-threonine phosphate dehydrogenase PdxA